DLAKIADLRVISRTSVMQYKSGAERNVREISQQHGVAHLLEGSVQRSGNRVRVTAQLIDARTDTQQWAERYDRDLADVFSIQSFHWPTHGSLRFARRFFIFTSPSTAGKRKRALKQRLLCGCSQIWQKRTSRLVNAFIG